MTRLQRLRELATTITAVTAAVAAVVAAGTASAALWGPLVTVALLTALGVAAASVLGLLAYQRLMRVAHRGMEALAAVEHHLCVNGREEELPPELRGQPLRSLVIGTVTRLDRGDRRFAEHERRIGIVEQREQEAS